MKKKDCLIFQTHVAKPGARLAFSKLNVEVGSRFDLKLLVDVTQAHIPTPLFGMEPLCFNLKGTNQEHVYVQKCAQHPGTLWPRNIDLPLLWFFNSNNDQYRYYWVMEYDVRSTGNWNYFFGAFELGLPVPHSEIATCSRRWMRRNIFTTQKLRQFLYPMLHHFPSEHKQC